MVHAILLFNNISFAVSQALYDHTDISRSQSHINGGNTVECLHQLLSYNNIISAVGLELFFAVFMFLQVLFYYLTFMHSFSTLFDFDYFLFRGDRGFVNPRSHTYNFLQNVVGIHSDLTELFFSHLIPNGLHLIGYSTFVIVNKILDHEQLQNLIERVSTGV